MKNKFKIELKKMLVKNYEDEYNSKHNNIIDCVYSEVEGVFFVYYNKNVINMVISLNEDIDYSIFVDRINDTLINKLLREYNITEDFLNKLSNTYKKELKQ